MLIHEQSSFSKLSVTSPTSQLILILQAFRHFTYVTAHSPTLPSLYLRHNTFSYPSVASPTSQLILQHFFRFSYVTGFSLTPRGEPPMVHGTHVETNADKWLQMLCDVSCAAYHGTWLGTFMLLLDHF